MVRFPEVDQTVGLGHTRIRRLAVMLAASGQAGTACLAIPTSTTAATPAVSVKVLPNMAHPAGDVDGAGG
jgi:hypothetical protein